MPRRPRYLIREVETNDLDELHRLAQHLNSVNFPHHKASLEKMIEASQRSFAGRMDPPNHACYMFVLVPEDDPYQLAGTSMIVAQHGTPSAPHVYFDVLEDERYSTTLDRHFRHTTLRLGFSYQGPTEIGALVLDPALRSGGLGKPLSFVRFVFMAMYRGRFRDEVIAELMPPLEPDGRSRLWEHIGRRFTDLDYQEADKLSQANKEFIISLFPMQMNATLLPEDVRALIGEVGENTRGVRRMLESIGFKYAERIDPFD
ncbi:MAG: arginine N-succinyltransferase, partial [Myxococcota bacterium]